MILFRICCAAALLLASFCAAATLQWQSINDPGVGGHVDSVKVSPYDPQRVLAGGDLLGIALSTNGGATWLDTYGLQGGYEVEEFTWHPSDSNTVWVGTMSGPYVSTDGGRNWTKKRSGFPAYVWGYHVAPVQKVLFDPGNSLRLLAFTGNHRGFANASGIGSATQLGKVFASTDGGNTWSNIATLGTNHEVMAAAWKPGSTGTVYAATVSGIYISADGGLTWAQATNGLPSGRASSLAVTPAAPEVLWVALSSKGVFKSTNGGATFTASTNGVPLNSGDSYYAVAVSASDANVVYVSNPNTPDRHLYRSADGGNSWSIVSSFGSTAYPFYSDFMCLDIDPVNPRHVFTATATTVWRTFDGTNFTDVSATRLAANVFRSTGWSGEVATEFRYNPFNPNESSICAMDSGKWVSRDNFTTWVFGGGGRGKGMDDWSATADFAFARAPGYCWALKGQFSSGGRIYRTTNGGASWITAADPPGVTASSSQPWNVYVLPDDPTQAWVLWSGKLFYTTNNGSAWTQIATNAGSLRVMEGNPFSPVQPLLYLGSDSGVFVSSNGVDFTQIPGNSSGNPKRVSRIKLDPAKPDRFYCLNPAWSDQNTFDTGLWRRDGTNWTKLSTEGGGPIYHMADVDVDPADNRRLLLATDEDPFYNNTGETGVWLSEDTGATWRQENAGLPCLRVSVVRFRPDNSGFVVAGLNGRGYYVAQMPPAQQRLIAAGSTWRYNDAGTNLGTAWRSVGYNDSAWPSGPSMLGFGDANGLLPATVISNRQQITFYFRQTFNVTNAAAITNLTARMLRDDGAAIYLNGVEVWRDNLPTGTLTWQTQAPTNITGTVESVWVSNRLNPALLVEGANTCAVEVHQSTNTSTDVAFNFELMAQSARFNTPPVASITAPAEGSSVFTPGTISVTASAFDVDGSIQLVEFFADGAKIGETTALPYSISWVNPPAGPHVITAAATDNSGARVESAPVRIESVARFVATGSAWRYNDFGTNCGTAWRGFGYNDSGWPSGPAMLGFGDANGQLPSTTISNRQQITLYFRQVFNVPVPGILTNLKVRLQRDDGAIVYLNSNEVFRSNIPGGTVNWLTQATTNVTGTSESDWVTNSIDPSLLLPGDNLLAVEVHQYTNTSTDVAFDLELIGNAAAAPTNMPRISIRLEGTNVVISGVTNGAFTVESTTNLQPPAIWSPVQATNSAADRARFFRLRWP